MSPQRPPWRRGSSGRSSRTRPRRRSCTASSDRLAATRVEKPIEIVEVDEDDLADAVVNDAAPVDQFANVPFGERAVRRCLGNPGQAAGFDLVTG